jgi:hypothetical protein
MTTANHNPGFLTAIQAVANPPAGEPSYFQLISHPCSGCGADTGRPCVPAGFDGPPMGPAFGLAPWEKVPMFVHTARVAVFFQKTAEPERASVVQARIEAQDNKLMELAAKAAGLTLRWIGNEPTVPYTAEESAKRGGIDGYQWNPRDDDGDSQRLAADVCISITQMPSSVAACHGNDYWPELMCEYASEYIGLDRRAATRLAVFRVAVEVGRAMP